MTFEEILDQAIAILQRRGRLTYGTLKRQFQLDDEALDDLKEELLFAHPVVDADGRGLVWTSDCAPLEPDVQRGTDAESRFYTVLRAVLGLLQRERRITYRELKHVFGLDETVLMELREALLFKHVARDEAGTGLVWIGEGQPAVPPLTAMPVQQDIPGTAEVTSPVAPTLPPLVTKTATPSNGPTAPPEALPRDAPYDEPAVTTELIRTASEAERRQLTVMFCDLADSTQLSQQLDPEDLREVVRAYQTTAADIIHQYEGHMAQYLGDGLLMYFGWPVAHEDDAQRSLYAGLGLVEAVTTTLNPRLEKEKGVQLTVRLGIHTGPVVVGAMGGDGRHENLATGETVNIAARLEGLAAPNTVVISNATARLVKRAFHLESLGPQKLKGVAESMHVFRVLGPLEMYEDETAAVGVPFLVGRDEEVGLLLRRWEQSKAGLGQVVLISGEAGIGKSSLVNVLRLHVAREGYVSVTLRCSPYHQHSVLYPVIKQMHRVLQIERNDPPDVKLAKLEQGLQTYRFASEEVVPLFAQLLSVPLPVVRYPPLTSTPQQQRQQTLDALIAWHLEEAERQHMLVVWEDLHWADPSTLDYLGLLIVQAPTVALLSVFMFRPEFMLSWPMRSHMTSLTLNRLEREQVEIFVTQLSAGKPLPSEVVEHIVLKTDGVPFYVEELTKMLLESDLLQEETDRYILRGQLSKMAIPVTLHDSLMARLDRGPMVREVAQLGAVLGREFTYEMLRILAARVAMDEALLQEGLANLVATELLYQRGHPPQATYVFKHVLIRDAAYQSLLRRTRQQYHQHVAQILLTRFPEAVETEPEVVAHHFTEAGCTEQAITFWHRAGQRAIQRSANLEAIGHLTRGLEVLEAIPDTAAYIKQELQLHTTLGPVFMAAKGYAAAEVERSYIRARELCEQLGETPQLFQVMLGLWNVYLVRAELKRARDLAEQCLSLGQRLQDKTRLHQAHYALGNTLFHSGEFTAAQEHLDRAIALYTPYGYHPRAVQNSGVVCLSYMAWTLWYLGYPDQALQRSQEAVASAQELSHPYSLTFALDFSAWLYQHRRETDAARQEVQAAITLAKEQTFPLWLAMGTPLEGWARVKKGQSQEGLNQLHQGMTAFRATGAAVFWPNILALLAESYASTGQVAAGLHVLEDALTTAQKNGEHMYEAELQRLNGELLLQLPSDNATEAEACFHQALTIARRQQAKSLELRAATSLSQLWQQQGKRQDAHDLLAPIYGWFTEGFDTADLQDAKALLEALA